MKNKEEIIDVLEWALKYLDNFIFISNGAAFSYDGTEHVGFTVKYRKARSLLHRLKGEDKKDLGSYIDF